LSDGQTISNTSGQPEYCCIGAVAAITAFAVAYHEPWADEAQAWQLVRSNSLRSLFTTNIRYEGTPGLWHFFLWLLIKAHVSYDGLHWICGAIGIISSALFVLASPFPRYLRLTIPFTYFLVFQYAIIARSYVLVPPLLFAIAFFWERSPIAVSILLGLLGNVSLHATVISGSLFAIFLLREIRKPERETWKKLVLCAILVVALYTVAVWTALPPRDISFSPQTEPRPFIINMVLALIVGVAPPWYLSAGFWLAIAIWFGGRRSLIYLTPILVLSAFCASIYASFWHVGLFIPLLLTMLWITWPVECHITKRSELLGLSALSVVVAVQISWSTYALWYDHFNPYSPDLAAATFLKPFVDKGDTIAVTSVGNNDSGAFNDVGLLPYFDHNIYENQSKSYWWWSKFNETDKQFDIVLKNRPQIVIAESIRSAQSSHAGSEALKIAELHDVGYRLTNTFCGTMPQRLTLWISDCHLIFQYEGAPGANK